MNITVSKITSYGIYPQEYFIKIIPEYPILLLVRGVSGIRICERNHLRE